MIGQVAAFSDYQLDRLGCFTASEIYRLITPPKEKEAKDSGELGKTARDYVREKVAELMTGTYRSIENAAIAHGQMYEPEAAAELEKRYPGLAYFGGDSPKFFKYTDFSGGSPDAIHGLTLVFEIKCPENPQNHVEYLLLEDAAGLLKLMPQYFWQIQMNMLCVAKVNRVEFSEMRGVFVSYYPHVLDGYGKLKLLHVLPDTSFPARLDKAVKAGEKYMGEVIKRVRRSE